MVLPPLPVPTEPSKEEKGGAPTLQVFVNRIRVLGVTAFSDEEIAEVTAPFEHQTITTEDLERVRLALTLLYVNKGYVTSGAVVPDQTVQDGVVSIQVIEGSLSQINIEGTNWFRPRYLRDRIELGAGTPVNIVTLQERLQLLQQDTRIDRINAELKPGVVRGESALNVRVSEANPIKAWLEFNNFQTPVVGAERGLATIAHQNLTGNGDQASFTYGRSRGVNPIVDFSYVLPVTPYDTTLSLSYRRNDFLVVEQQFEALHIESQAEIIGLTLRQPVYRTPDRELALSVTGEYLFNKTLLSGVPFPFVAGMNNGVGNVSALRFAQEWISRSQSTVFAVRSRFTVGLNVLGATINDGPVADSQFFAWLGQAQAVQRFDEYGGLQVLGRADVQVADDRLFPLEQLPVGGRFSVRGYRENTLVRDNAFLASIEGRYPVMRSVQGEDLLQLAAFSDFGQSWNAKGSTVDPQFLASVGLGLRWAVLPKERARFELYWGLPLNYVTHPKGNLQDHGLHLQVIVQAF
jgi:hemolysin activation/secretion protein